MHVGKLLAVGDSLGIIIPAASIRELGWTKGDYIAVEVDGAEVKLHSVRSIQTRFTTVDGRGRNGADGAAQRD